MYRLGNRSGLWTLTSLFPLSPALVMISLAWMVLAQTSQWCAHGKPSATWSSATWPNTASFKPTASSLPRLPAPFLCLILSTWPSLHLSLARRDKAASKPPNALSSIYLLLCATKWTESIMMLLFLYYNMILFTVYILEMKRRENHLHLPFSFPLHPPSVVSSRLLPPPHVDFPASLCHSRPTAMDASKTLVNTSLYLLLAVITNVNNLF